MYFVTDDSQLFQVNNNFKICFETDRFLIQILQLNQFQVNQNYQKKVTKIQIIV